MTTIAAALTLLLIAVTPALALDASQIMRKGATVLSVEAGGGSQNNLQNHREQSDLDLWYVGMRYSLLPFEPAGPSILRGALEVGLEPIYQRYSGGREGFWAGLSLHGRWNLLGLSFGRFVPYVEAGAGAGGTDLKAIEIDSTFAFLLSVGAGASFFITDRAAIYGGYRMVHISNGNIEKPNRGFEADTGLVGFSYFFK
jgi:opacity protein-like surface antigen